MSPYVIPSPICGMPLKLDMLTSKDIIHSYSYKGRLLVATFQPRILINTWQWVHHKPVEHFFIFYFLLVAHLLIAPVRCRWNKIKKKWKIDENDFI